MKNELSIRSPARTAVKHRGAPMYAGRAQRALMQQRAERMCQAARAAAVRASEMRAAATASQLLAQRMRSDNERMLAAARTGLQWINNAPRPRSLGIGAGRRAQRP